jgi:hypothetical protein
MQDDPSGTTAYYLVRGLRDENRSGAFSVFLREGVMLVEFSHFGACGEPRRTALIVRTNATVAKVFGGCSGVD